MFDLKTHCCGETILTAVTLERTLVVARRERISLRGVDLSGFWLPNVDLSGLDLREADLSYSNFENSTFKGADLSNAIVTGATFSHCNLVNVNRLGITFDVGALEGAVTLGSYREPIQYSGNAEMRNFSWAGQVMAQALARVQSLDRAQLATEEFAESVAYSEELLRMRQRAVGSSIRDWVEDNHGGN